MALDSLSQTECWECSGMKKTGKNKGELNVGVAIEMFDEVMDKHHAQMEAYYRKGKPNLEIQYLMALMKGIAYFEVNHKSKLYPLIEESMMDFMSIAENDWKNRHLNEEEYRRTFYDHVKKYYKNWESFFDEEEFEDEDEGSIE